MEKDSVSLGVWGGDDPRVIKGSDWHAVGVVGLRSAAQCNVTQRADAETSTF